jgi:hypothetical protein
VKTPIAILGPFLSILEAFNEGPTDAFITWGDHLVQTVRRTGVSGVLESLLSTQICRREIVRSTGTAPRYGTI